MRYQIGEYIVEREAIEAAKWNRIESGNPTTWEREDWNDHNIIAVHGDGEAWWDGLEVYGVPATDSNDNACTIQITLDVCDDESSHIYVGTEYASDECDCYSLDEDGDKDDYVSPYDLAQIAGFEVGGLMEMDYDEAADAFLGDHDGYRYIMDNARGFANEWTLYACANDDEAAEALDAFEDVAEYTPEDARYWIRCALQSGDDYEAEHGCKKCVALKYWKDNEIY